MNNNIWEDLEVFEIKNAYVKNKSFISINKKGTSFVLSGGFTHIAAEKLDECEYVLLLFSRKYRIIGFKFIKDPEIVGALGIVKSVMGNACYIRSKYFISYYDINLEELRGKYEPKLENIPEHGEVWTINLNEKKML